jgi:hypothetical protein
VSAEDVRIVREALHTLTAVSFQEDVDDAAIHENSLEAYAALARLEARLAEVELASQQRYDYGEAARTRVLALEDERDEWRRDAKVWQEIAEKREADAVREHDACEGWSLRSEQMERERDAWKSSHDAAASDWRDSFEVAEELPSHEMLARANERGDAAEARVVELQEDLVVLADHWKARIAEVERERDEAQHGYETLDGIREQWVAAKACIAKLEGERDEAFDVAAKHQLLHGKALTAREAAEARVVELEKERDEAVRLYALYSELTEEEAARNVALAATPFVGKPEKHVVTKPRGKHEL